MMSSTQSLPPPAPPPPFELPPPPPVAAAAHPAEQFVDDLVAKAERFAREEPARAVAIALASGVALNVLPTRFLVKTVTAVTLTVLRPTLLTLGLLKAFEICTSKQKPTIQS